MARQGNHSLFDFLFTRILHHSLPFEKRLNDCFTGLYVLPEKSPLGSTAPTMTTIQDP